MNRKDEVLYKLKEDLQKLQAYTYSGKCPSYEQYKYYTGQINGITHCIETIKEVYKED